MDKHTQSKLEELAAASRRERNLELMFRMKLSQS